jgi:hypothetical protein
MVFGVRARPDHDIPAIEMGENLFDSRGGLPCPIIGGDNHLVTKQSVAQPPRQPV